jgi:UTP--glucose-1-phosphate uridylyltransferase
MPAIHKALITAAGPRQNTLPLQRLVDRDGVEKSALQMIIEEVLAAGIESVGIVIRPGDESAYRMAAGTHADRLCFLVQQEPRGYADAILCGRDFAEDQPVLHLVGDHLYLSRTASRCAQQLVEVAVREQCVVSAVQPTRETMLPHFGAVGATRLPQQDHLYEVHRVVEKPTPTLAEQELSVSGLRSGYYLCFFGMHVLHGQVFRLLESAIAHRPGKATLADALDDLAGKERYLACDLEGTRFNLGVQYGLLWTQLGLSLAGVDRERVLADLVELMAVQASGRLR